MRKQHLSLTVGITTCYGEDSILETVKSIRSQHDVDRFRFVVIADRVPINVNVKRGFEKYNVELIENKTEGSLSTKQKQLIDLCETDLIMLTQDDVLYSPFTFKKIIRAFEKDSDLKMLSIKNQHLEPLTKFEDVVNVGTRIVNKMAKSWNKGDNYLTCGGRCMTYRTRWVKENIKIPDQIVNDDAYLYFANKRAGGKFKYLSNANVLFRNPQKMVEHLRKSSRFQYSQMELLKYFRGLSQEYKVPVGILLKAMISEFVGRPIQTSLYFGVFFYTKLRRLDARKVLKPIWEVDISTKKLLSNKYQR